MLLTVPTTLAGALALVRHVADRHARGDERLLEDGATDDFLSTLSASLGALMVRVLEWGRLVEAELGN
jgi:hypothetical protein